MFLLGLQKTNKQRNKQNKTTGEKFDVLFRQELRLRRDSSNTAKILAQFYFGRTVRHPCHRDLLIAVQPPQYRRKAPTTIRIKVLTKKKTKLIAAVRFAKGIIPAQKCTKIEKPRTEGN